MKLNGIIYILNDKIKFKEIIKDSDFMITFYY